MPVTNVATTLPNEYSIDQGDIQRKLALAQMLQEQSLQSPPNETAAGGITVKQSPLQGMARMLQAYGSGRMQDRVEQQQKDLVLKATTNRQDSLNKYMQLSATGNRQAALAALLSSPDPALQQMGMSEMQKEMQRQRFAQLISGGNPGNPQAGNPGIPGNVPTVGGGYTAQGVPQDLAALLGESDNPVGDYTKLAEKLREPKMDQNGRWSQRQFIDGKWQVAPMAGSVNTAQQFEDIKNANEMVEVPVPGGTQRMTKAQWLKMQNQPTPAAPTADFQGSPDQIIKQIMSIPDPKERVAAFTAYTTNNQPGATGRLGFAPDKATQAADEVKTKDKAQKAVDAPQAQKQIELTVRPIDNAIGNLSALMDHPGLNSVTGPIAGRLPSVRDNSANAQAAINTAKTQISGLVMQAMRDASKTGGAVGNVTEKEWPRLEGMIASLDQAQTTEAFKAKVLEIQNHLLYVRESIAKAHLADYPTATLPAGPGAYKPPAQSARGAVRAQADAIIGK